MVTRQSIVPTIIAVHPGNTGVEKASSCLQVSTGDELVLLSVEVIERANRVLHLSLTPGVAGETLTMAGVDVASLNPGASLFIGDDVKLYIESPDQQSLVILDDPRRHPLLQQHGIFVRAVSSGVICSGSRIQRS